MTLTLSEPDASLSAIAGTSEADHSVAMMPSHREIAAHHEAGHAVTALAFRVPVRSASIRPRKATFGRVITPRLPDKDVDIEIYIALAGPFAHRRFAPGSNWLTGDFAIAEKLFGKGCSGTARNKEKYAAYIVDHAEGFVDYFWADIKVAAKALLTNTRR